MLKHLSIAFQGYNDEANLLAEFYSCTQRAKESEEAFADELQLLARKVISKKPDFCLNSDTTLKQQYANQLYNCNSASIAKTLLMQMLHVSFTQFRNELARVLGTHQHSAAKSTGKSISTSSVGVKSDEEGTVFKSQCKWDKKLSAQSFQIKDLHTNWIAQLPKILEFRNCSIQLLSKWHLPMHYRLQSGVGNKGSNNSQQGKPFLGKPQEPQLSAGRMGALTQTNPVTIAKIWVMIWEIAFVCKNGRCS